MLKIFAAFNVLLYYSYAYLYLWQVQIVTIKPLLWYLFSLGVGFFLLIVSGRLHLRSPASRYIVIWALTFISVCGISYALTTHPEAGRQLLISWGEAVFLLILFVMLFQDRMIRRYAVFAVLLAVIASVFINYFDFLFPAEGRFSKDLGRAAGMYGNANISGGLLAFGMVLSVWILPTKLRLTYCLFVGSGIIVTFSRSAMLMWVMAMLLLAWRGGFSFSRLRDTVIIGVLVAVIGGGLVAGKWIGIFEVIGVASYLDENTASRIGGSFTSQDDSSSKSRIFAAKRAWEVFLKSPIVGHGLGATQEGHTRVGAHNMYLQLAVELGVIGIAFIFLLLWILVRAGTNVSSTVALLYGFSSLFTHNYLEQPAMQIVIALAIVGVGGREAVAAKHVLINDNHMKHSNKVVING